MRSAADKTMQADENMIFESPSCGKRSGMEVFMERYDIAVIGTGPAGISAAITAKVRNKNIILLGSRELSSKIEKAHAVNNYPGLPNQGGEELKEAFLKHLDSLDISITEEKVNAVYALGEYFVIQGQNGDYEADSVILATGFSVVKPYPGENENLGRGVSYCATCDAAFYRGKTAAVIAFSQKEESEARFLSEIADKVLYFKMYKDDSEGVESSGGVSIQSMPEENIEIITGVKPLSIKKAENTMELETSGGNYTVDGVFILRDTVAPTQLVPGLKVADNHVETGRDMSTNIKGLFACGDITGAPYQYVKSAGEGNVAALSAVAYLGQRGK